MDEILTLCDNRSLKSTKYKSTGHAEEYKLVHNIIRRSMKYLIAGSESELQIIIDSQEKASTAYGM